MNLLIPDESMANLQSFYYNTENYAPPCQHVPTVDEQTESSYFCV